MKQKNNNTFGSTYKHIRQARKLSQHSVTKEKISRSSLSKFEHNKQTIYLDNFLSLLDELELSFGEFMFIDNNYQLTYADKLKDKFYQSHFTGNIPKYRELHKEIKNHLKESYDWYLEVMQHYLDFLIRLETDATGQQAEKLEAFVVEIWENMKSFEKWFINDIRLLNVLIYYLPSKTADQAIQMLIERAMHYEEADVLKSMIPSLYLNSSLVYIKNGMYHNASTYTDKALETIQKNHRYDFYITALIRKGTSTKEFIWIHKGLQLALDLNDHQLHECLNIEVINNVPMYFTKYPEDLENIEWSSENSEEHAYKFNGYYWFPL
ncbi:MAG TPA: hypothetical protein VK048_02745 [Atopostipes sp.]|nr:hypothetical protein [Atopostipes sp.]